MEEFNVDKSLPVDKQIEQLVNNDLRLYVAVTGTQKSVEDLTIRIDESNKYLREQNNRILSEVLTGNQESKRRADERKHMQDENRAKFWVTAVGSGGIVVLLLQLIYQILTNK